MDAISIIKWNKCKEMGKRSLLGMKCRHYVLSLWGGRKYKRLLLLRNRHSINNIKFCVRPGICFLPSRSPASHHPPQCAVIYGSFTNSASNQTISCSSPVSSFATRAGSVPPITASVNATA